MTDAELDCLMHKVLIDAVALDAASINHTENTFQPSRNHSGQMRRMLKNPLNWVKKRNPTQFQIMGKWTAVILLFISLGVGFVMLFSVPTRAAFERWIVEWWQNHIVYRYSGENECFPQYKLTWLPEGFSELERIEEPTFTDVIYGNESGELINFVYMVMTEGGATVFVPSGDSVSEVMVGKKQGRLFIPQDPESLTTLTWIDDEAGVQFTISANLDESEMIRLAEGLRIEKKK